MKRDLYARLLSWKSSPRRKPLVLQGARQVGKTWLLKAFGNSEYDHLASFNFDEDPGLDDLFQGSLEPSTLIERLSAYDNERIKPGATLIVLDEIQESPGALNSLKYFCEKAGQYHVIAAGSLLGIKLTRTKPFPVGKVNFLHLYPMTFFEFLTAVGKLNLRRVVEEHTSFTPLLRPFHDELIDLLRIYYYTGGMPEVVSSYLATRDFSIVRDTQKEILQSYALDFSKHAPSSDVMKISQIWESIPTHLSRENKKFTFSTLSKNARARAYENALQWLVDAGLIYKSYNVSIPGVPLEGYAEHHIFKLFMLDTGLLGAMLDLTPKTIVEGNKLFTHFKGAFVENYVAQELRARHERQLYYWTSRGRAEIDFIVAKDEEVLPLEVKSGMVKRSKSLGEYGKRYKPSLLSRTSQSNFSTSRGICNYPLYAASLFPDTVFLEGDRGS